MNQDLCVSRGQEGSNFRYVVMVVKSKERVVSKVAVWFLTVELCEITQFSRVTFN